MTRIVRVDRPLLERVVAPAVVSLPVTKGQRLGEVRVYAGRQLIGRMPLVASRSISKPGFARARGLVREADAPSHRELVLVIVTVTLNAAIDRTLTVPNFQLGQRHRASAGPDARRRQGHQRRPRAQAARRARRRHRARRRAHRHADHRGADRRGDPQRLRPDRRRVADVDRGRRPDQRLVHGDQRVGAARRARRARDAARQASLPRRAARTSSSSPARSRAASSRTSTRR